MAHEMVRLVSSAFAAWACRAGAAAPIGLIAFEQIVPGGWYDRRRPNLIDTVDLSAGEFPYAGYIASRGQAFRPIHRLVLRDALVTDQGAVIARDGSLLNESCWEFLTHGHVPHGLVREGPRAFQRILEPTELIRKPTLLLKRPWWRNYGHWLIDAAALAALVHARGVGGYEQVLIGAPETPKLREIFHETLGLVAPGMPVIEHPDGAMWAFSELHYVEPVRYSAMVIVPEALAALRSAVLGGADRARPTRRLFVSRGELERRRLVNEPAIVDRCAQQGFEVVQPEHLGLRAQAELFSAAEAVIGVKGAALTNIIFSLPGTSLIVLSPEDFSDPIFWDIAGALKIGYSEMFGRVTTTVHGLAQNPFTIDTARFDTLLSATIATATTPDAPEPLMSDPREPEVPVPFLSQLSGEFYQACLGRIHARFQPHTYLEIGTLHGDTLALARCRAAAVDPAFQMTASLPGKMPSLFLFQGPSDDFFQTVDPPAVLGGPIDLAFIDGLHLFEVVLRDFMNIERHCHPGSMIVLHDCIPLDLEMTTRDPVRAFTNTDPRFAGWWTGDAWKAVDALIRHRPDLDIIGLDAPPTGLVVIRNIDPSSSVLTNNSARIIAEYAELREGPALASYLGRLPIYSTSIVDQFNSVAALD